jgi:beta-lactamase superfamily II metal-dependent hydrolase
LRAAVAYRWLGLSLLAWIAFSTSAWAGPDDGCLDIYWIDVEGGAATLLVTPAGETLLVDSGNPGRRDPERIVQVVGKIAARTRIDHLVTTHYHGDHFGGAINLSTLMPIGTVYDNGVWPELTEKPTKDYFDFKCEKRVVLNRGDKIPLKQGTAKPTPLTITCLGGRQSFVEPTANSPENAAICANAREKNRDGSDNANSVVLVVEFGPFRFFDAGDLTWNQEARLVCPKNLVGKVDVYQVTHHGLDASNNPLVVKTLEPRVAIMNNGVTKGCMPEVFATLKEQPTIEGLYQVHKNMRPDGEKNNVADEYIANHGTDKECAGNYIKLAVAPDGKSYKVSIPANKHEREFKTK